MRFDTTNIHSCQNASACNEGTLDGGVTDPRCADATFCLSHPEICGTTCGGAEPCSDPAYRASHLTECGDDDPRCTDPVFAAENPALCLNVPTLILKPEFVVREIGKSVQYTAVLLLNGAEVELSSGVIYSSGGTSIAVIGSSSGNATGLSLGIVTIAAQYGTLHAFAQLEIVPAGACDVRANYFALVLDHSKSTGGPMSSLSASRLALAKKQASLFSDTVNLSKDLIGLMSFDADSAELLGFISSASDLPALKQAVNGIAVNSIGRTNIGNALTEAKSFLESNAPATGSLKVVVLFSDGENNEGPDPVAIANEMKGEGFIIFVLGLRAKGNAFRMLDRIATGGFFINALSSNDAQVAGWLAGLKGYICSGNCEPAGGEVIGQPALNFSDFADWDVTAGEVDLIGKNEGGPEDFDLRPGNGLYVDDHGSGPDFLGEMTTKDTFSLTSGHTYRLSIDIAGNSRESGTTRDTQVRVINTGDSNAVLDETITLDSDEDFAVQEFEFTPGSNMTVDIVINSLDNAGTEISFGNLIKSVKLEDVTAPSVLFLGTFSDDNASYVNPACSGDSGTPVSSSPSGTGYGTGYSCNSYGCLTSPIPVQVPDSSPYHDLESA